MKKIIASLLALVFVLSLAPVPAYAADGGPYAANALYKLGLFQGVGTGADGKPDFALDRNLTRNEAVTMLVRLLGKEQEAKTGNWDIPFTDVAEWAKPYVGYAYANGLTTGTSSTTFSGGSNATAYQYITFLLRALGYQDGVDFKWNESWKLSNCLGVTHGTSYNKPYNQRVLNFSRGNAAIISYMALSRRLKGTETNLITSIMNSAFDPGAHTHIYQTYNIPEFVSHVEQIQIGTQTLEVGLNDWLRECPVCGYTTFDRDEFEKHQKLGNPCAGSNYIMYLLDDNRNIPTGTYVEGIYEYQTVPKTAAVTINKCEVCGQQEPSENHTHVYKAVTEGRYGYVQTGTKSVVTGYNKTKVWQCPTCKVEIPTSSVQEVFGHYDSSSPYYSEGCSGVGGSTYTTELPVYEDQPVYESRWIEASPEKPARLCEICGRQE